MEILMPQLGETVAEGKITTWFKAIGDAVKPGDNLFEIETDKVSMEVPATAAGVLREIRVCVGEIAPVGAIVAVMSGAGDAAAPAAATSTPARSAAIVVPTPPAPAAVPAQHIKLDPFREVRTPERNWGPAKLPSGMAVTPLARRLAGEAGIDLTRIAPSGPHGRIVARDIETAVATRVGRAARAPTGGETPPLPSPERIMALYEPGSFQEIPLDNMRRTIAARLTTAQQTIPHFYLTADADIDRLNALRAEANAALPDAGGAPASKLSINDFIIKALALALQRVPAANAVWAEDRILRFRRSDVAVAVAMEDGLVTPVVRGAESKSLLAISADMKDLAARARQRKLKPAEIAGGATAISNLGMHGVREFAAIINPPHATILAVGAVARRPVETADGAFRFVSQMTVTLSCDHRVVDGALGAELLNAFRHFVEHPVSLMI
jgi:pyruvate dehydrogenase E2 component (dihydrolipoamide acetyltransferase)